MTRARILAGRLAQNAVRKEICALRRLLKRAAGENEISAFYRDHARFVSYALAIPLAQAEAELQRHRDILEAVADRDIEARLAVIAKTVDRLADIAAAGDAPRDSLGV